MPPLTIVSPHFDDAVLSCWTVLSSGGQVEVVNVFAGTPSGDAPPGWWDQALGTPAEAIRTRAEEDRRALARAGRASRNLDFLDAQYRGRDEPAPGIGEAVERLLAPGATVYAPASLGVHPDHEAVRAAALELWRCGHRVVLYADLPHASLRGWPDWVAGDGTPTATDAWNRTLRRVGLEPESLSPRVTRLDERAIAAKLGAVREYASQLPGFEAIFGVPLDDAGQLRYEVEWALPPARADSSSAVAAVRKPAAS
jgi:LmbE family N-acetylglucosaminyl deacetylase